jgi:Xaa-Pro aminopeptidase
MLPRAEARVSKPEMQRRYAAVRENMRRMKLDTLLVSGVRFVATWGYLRYLTNWAEPFAGEYLLFPLEGEPVFFARTSERVHLVRDVLGLHCLLGSAVPVVAKEIQDRKLRKVGICSLRTMMADFYVGLTRAVPDCEFVEAAAAVDEARMLKSPEELEWVYKSAALGDLAYQVFSDMLQEGVTEHQIFTELDHIVKQAGAENTYFMMGAGSNPILRFMDMATHRYEKGDLVLFNAEIGGPGGYFSQLVRSLSLGPPRAEVEKSYRVASAALDAAEALLKPGTGTNTIYQTIRDAFQKEGYQLNLHPGHSQGLDIFERPIIDGKENVELQPGMVIILHPYVDLPSGGGAWVGETFLITGSGHERLHRSTRALAVRG